MPPLNYLIDIDALDEIDGSGDSDFLRNLLNVVNKQAAVDAKLNSVPARRSVRLYGTGLIKLVVLPGKNVNAAMQPPTKLLLATGFGWLVTTFAASVYPLDAKNIQGHTNIIKRAANKIAS
jgi:hypothetical protein